MSESGLAEVRTWEALPPWQDDAAAAALAERSWWPHALLLTGRQGVGKRLLAMHLARALLCETPRSDGSACGDCTSCGLVERGSHPDLRLIEPFAYDDEGNATPVDAITVEPTIIDRVRATVESSPRRQGRGHHPAERNAAAANALLKTLEEPPPRTYLLLVSHQPGRLPATIVSRCRRLPVPDPDPALASQWLADRNVADPELVLAQAGGAPMLALSLADPAVQQARKLLLGELARPERLSPVAVGARLEAVPKDQRKGELASAVYWLLTWTADLAAVASGGAPRFHPDRRDVLGELARRVARVPLFRYYRMVLRQRALLGHPLQPRLVAEALFVRIPRDLHSIHSRTRNEGVKLRVREG
jgi:DNA polymerase-3 subunit delta'